MTLLQNSLCYLFLTDRRYDESCISKCSLFFVCVRARLYGILSTSSWIRDEWSLDTMLEERFNVDAWHLTSPKERSTDSHPVRSNQVFWPLFTESVQLLWELIKIIPFS